jgi:large subunit ribosomal protein L24
MYRIRKNDIVMVISGEFKGKTGRVLKNFTRTDRVIVEGVNFIKRHTRPSQTSPQGGIVEKEAPIHVSNVKLIHNGKPTKVSYQVLKDGKKVRCSRKTQEVIDTF